MQGASRNERGTFFIAGTVGEVRFRSYEGSNIPVGLPFSLTSCNFGKIALHSRLPWYHICLCHRCVGRLFGPSLASLERLNRISQG
jgi:hypothetical protein